MLLASLVLPVLLVVPGPEPPPEVEAAAVLHAWDDRRAVAWAAGDVSALAALYEPGSRAGRTDVRMLREWRSRGLTVHAMTTQLLRLDVRRVAADRVVLDVRDRLVSAVAVGPGVRVRLPAGPATTRRLVLTRDAGEWRVAQSVEDASPARTTSWTVRSRKE
jgi:hypothetical protein